MYQQNNPRIASSDVAEPVSSAGNVGDRVSVIREMVEIDEDLASKFMQGSHEPAVMALYQQCSRKCAEGGCSTI